jgi:hypothetical protein
MNGDNNGYRLYKGLHPSPIVMDDLILLLDYFQYHENKVNIDFSRTKNSFHGHL